MRIPPAPAYTGRSWMGIVILILPSNDHVPGTTITFHDAAIYSGTDTVGIRVESIVVGMPRCAILIGHAGRVWIMGYSYAIMAIIVSSCLSGPAGGRRCHWVVGGCCFVRDVEWG